MAIWLFGATGLRFSSAAVAFRALDRLGEAIRIFEHEE